MPASAQLHAQRPPWTRAHAIPRGFCPTGLVGGSRPQASGDHHLMLTPLEIKADHLKVFVDVVLLKITVD